MVSVSKNSGMALESKKDPEDLIKFHYLKKTILVGMRNPSKREKKEYETGETILKVIEKPNHFIILLRVGILEWCDVAYSFYLDLKDENYNYEEILQESYTKKFNLVLFNTESRNIIVKRQIVLSDEFALKLRNLVLEQIKTTFKYNEYKKAVNDLYKKYTSEQLALSKLDSAAYSISEESEEKIIEAVYDRFGYGTDKPIPKWIYHEIHNPKIYGIITKEAIPENLLRKGVIKCTYKHIKGKYWKVIMYKIKKVKKKVKEDR